MRLKAKRILQAIFLAIVPSSFIALFCHGWSVERRHGAGVAQNINQYGSFNSQMLETGYKSVGWQERAPRSISDSGKHFDNVNSSHIIHGEIQNNEVNAKNFTTDHNITEIKSNTMLDDIFISVKTTQKYHQNRLDLILRTWFLLAREQTWFFSDSSDKDEMEKTNGHIINTNCSSSHSRKALCCKMSVEFDTFLDSNKRWFCHFDDDNYVNIPQLVKLLQNYNPQEDWYLGKPSIKGLLEIKNKDNITQKISFRFATGGAGFCLSRALALKMIPLASGGKLISVGEKIRLPDDVTLGYIIEHIMKKKLTVVDKFHSHLEPMKFIKWHTLEDQITFSYSHYGNEMNVLQIDGFDYRVDPTRFLSLHCFLFPNFSFCPR